MTFNSQKRYSCNVYSGIYLSDKLRIFANIINTIPNNGCDRCFDYTTLLKCPILKYLEKFALCELTSTSAIIFIALRLLT